MLIDAHAHLDRYQGALETALEEIAQYRIFTISNSLDIPSYKRNLEIADGCDLVLATFGVHPWNAPEYVDHLESLGNDIRNSPLLGEIGLDFHFVEDESRYPIQRKVFEFFLKAARDQGKIVNVHTKGAERDVLSLLDRYEIDRAIIHWYSGPIDVLREFAARGFYLTIGVELLHSHHVETIAREVPLAQLLTETDNPGGPKSLTGTMGMPLLVRDVVHKLAELRQSTVNEIVQAVQDNLLQLIRDDPWFPMTCRRLLAKQHNGSEGGPRYNQKLWIGGS